MFLKLSKNKIHPLIFRIKEEKNIRYGKKFGICME